MSHTNTLPHSSSSLSSSSSQEAFHVHVKVYPCLLDLSVYYTCVQKRNIHAYVYTHDPPLTLSSRTCPYMENFQPHTEVPNQQLPQAQDEGASMITGLTDLTVGGETAPSVTGGNLTVPTTALSALCLLSSCPTDAQKQQVEVGNDNLVEMPDETDDLLASSGDDGLGRWLVESVSQSPKRDWATAVEDEEKDLLDSLEEGGGKSPSPVGNPPATASPAKTPGALPRGMS